MPDIEPRIKKIYTYFMKKLQKKIPTYPLNKQFLWMALSPWLGAAGIVILWHIRSPLLIVIFISVAFSQSFFHQTIRDWNALPDSLISSAEGAEDRVAKFTSLVRAGD